MKLLADETGHCGIAPPCALFGTHFGVDTLDLSLIEREIERALDSAWEFTDPADDPE